MSGRTRIVALFGRIRGIAVVAAAVIVVADQVTKTMVRHLVPLHDSITLVPGVVNLTHVRNTGAAFGIFNAADFPFKPAVMTGIAIAALIALAFYASRSASHSLAAQLGLALILGGAIGNLIDRVALGYVIDFVDVYWRTYHFWAFNVSDAAITVGAGLLLIDVLGGRNVSDPV